MELEYPLGIYLALGYKPIVLEEIIKSTLNKIICSAKQLSKLVPLHYIL